MNNVYIKHYADEDSLTHYGVKGMKWRKHKIKNPFQVDVENPMISQEEIEKKKANGDKYLRSRKELINIKRKQVSKSLKKIGSKSISSSKKAISKGVSWFKKNAITNHKTRRFVGDSPKKKKSKIFGNKTRTYSLGFDSPKKLRKGGYRVYSQQEIDSRKARGEKYLR